MSWPLPEKFKKDIPLRDLVTVEIMETVCSILNNIVCEFSDAVDRPTIVKSAVPSSERPWRILIPEPDDGGDPDTVTLTSLIRAGEGDDAAMTNSWTASAPFTNGCVIRVGQTVYDHAATNPVLRHWYRDVTVSGSGRILHVEPEQSYIIDEPKVVVWRGS
jgi:hypothetical protein